MLAQTPAAILTELEHYRDNAARCREEFTSGCGGSAQITRRTASTPGTG